MSFEITRKTHTTLSVDVNGGHSRLTVDVLMWFAREAQKAIDEGMPLQTEVKITDGRIRAQAVLTQDIP